MPEELKTGKSEELWEYIADCVQQFLEYHHPDEELETLPLGFTFSYPATQEYIDHGVLQRWTKGFDVEGVEGHDVVPMFEAALSKRVWVCAPDLHEHLKLIIFAESTYQSLCFDQRHHRNDDRVRLHGREVQNGLHLRHGVQRRLHGALR